MIENLLKLLASGQDSAMLRFGLGNAYLQEKEPANAIEHLQKAVELDPAYSAAWKLLGKALQQTGKKDLAADAWRKGIDVATENGDRQGAKEMGVFLKRLQRE